MKKRLLRLKSVLLLPMLFWLLMAMSMNGMAQETQDEIPLVLDESSVTYEPTVITNKADYAPGETVTIYGTHFEAGETVSIVISHIEPNMPLSYHSHELATATADGNGSFTAYWYVNDVELNTTLLLIATGDKESLASTVFTDAVDRHDIYFQVDGIDGTSVTVNWSGTNPTPSSFSGTTTFVAPGPTQSPQKVTVAANTSFSFSFPEITGYTINTSLPSPFTTGVKNGHTTVIATYVGCTPPTINSSLSGQPENQSINYGDNASFTVASSGTTPLSYKWEISKNNGVNWSNVSDETFTGYAGITATTLNITKPVVPMSGYKYRCVVTNSCGSATSNGNAMLTINAAELTVTGASVTTKYYDGTADAAITGATLAGTVYNNDDVTLANATSGTFNQITPGSGISVATAPMTLAGLTAGNYHLTQPILSGTINAAELTVTGASVTTKYYDGTADAAITGATLAGTVYNNDDVTLANATSGTFNQITPGSGISVATAPMTLAGLTAGNYHLTQPILSGTINAAELTVTGASVTTKYYDGTADAAITGATLAGTVYNNDDVTLANATSGTFNQITPGSGISVATAPMTLAGLTAGNYHLTQPILSGTINAAELTVTGASVTTKYYDGTADAAITGATLAGTIYNNDDVTLANATSGTFNQITPGSGISVATAPMTLAGLTAGNYHLTQPILSGTINAAELTVTGASVTTKYYDGTADAAITGATLAGTIYNNDDVTLANATSGTFNQITPGSGISVATAPMTLAGLTAGNYHLTQPILSGTINAAELTVTGASVTTKYYDGTADAAITGATLAGTIYNNDDVTLANATSGTFNQITPGSGISVATAPMTLAGLTAGNYHLTQPILSGTINAAELTVTGASVTTKYYDGTADAAITGATLAGTVYNNDDVTLANATSGTFNQITPGSGISVATAPMTLAGLTAGNYHLTQPILSGTINAAELTVTGASVTTKYYDGTADAAITGATLAGTVYNNDDVTLANATSGTFNQITPGSGISVATAPMTLAGLTAGNYHLTQPILSGTINAAELTVTGASVTTKYYDGTADAAITGATLAGTIYNNDDVTLANATSGTFNQITPGSGISVATAPMTLAGLTAGNYHLTQPILSGTIEQRPLTVTAIGVSKIYDGNTNAAVMLSTDKLSADDVIAAYTSASFDDPNGSLVGTSKPITVFGISISGTKASNYALLNTTATTNANITKATTTTTLTLSAPSVRFMDNLTMTAQIVPAGFHVPMTALTGTVQFKIGGVNYGGPIPVVPIPDATDGSVQASLIPQVSNLPGNYTVEAIFTSTNLNYSGDDDSKSLTVKARNASPFEGDLGFYTGDLFVWTTGPNSSTGTILLATTIKDLNSPRGDLRGAKVTFYLVNGSSMTPIPSAQNIPVGLVDINDGSVGTASAIIQLNIGSANAANYQIAVGISGAYYNAPGSSTAQSIVTISKPVPGGYMVTGGKIKNLNSSGYIKGQTNLYTDFESDIQFTKSGTNPKGKTTVMIRSYYKTDGTLDATLHTYIITTNAIASLNVANPLATATFSAKANLVEQLEDGSTINIEGGAAFQMVAFQNACDKQIAITLNRKAGGIWFSSNWSATKTALQPIYAGEVSVAGGGTCTTNLSAPVLKVAEIIPEVVLEPTLKVYPNPFTERLNIEFSSANDTQAFLEIYSITGAKLETLFNGPVEGGVFYKVEYVPNLVSSQMVLYKLTMDGKTQVGKMMYNERR
ncbi:hypothetical protein AQPE_4701 [Aquipluma nitroreducens]|uniref:Ig-like domain-containing protein n=1 Tax=Aquipluma nitroreducens TaxID=2010828 RepID=A0A5K7SFZ8_9BACT|nr:YDG domain-containing protein [Aquipluma nitroreducens]BBE20508.1 hypothetical protein AQPE_4701 [Aquipluma nitroreducens]